MGKNKQEKISSLSHNTTCRQSVNPIKISMFYDGGDIIDKVVGRERKIKWKNKRANHLSHDTKVIDSLTYTKYEPSTLNTDSMESKKSEQIQGRTNRRLVFSLPHDTFCHCPSV